MLVVEEVVREGAPQARTPWRGSSLLNSKAIRSGARAFRSRETPIDVLVRYL
jgi:hypothetical protein